MTIVIDLGCVPVWERVNVVREYLQRLQGRVTLDFVCGKARYRAQPRDAPSDVVLNLKDARSHEITSEEAERRGLWQDDFGEWRNWYEHPISAVLYGG